MNDQTSKQKVPDSELETNKIVHAHLVRNLRRAGNSRNECRKLDWELPGLQHHCFADHFEGSPWPTRKLKSGPSRRARSLSMRLNPLTQRPPLQSPKGLGEPKNHQTDITSHHAISTASWTSSDLIIFVFAWVFHRSSEPLM